MVVCGCKITTAQPLDFPSHLPHAAPGEPLLTPSSLAHITQLVATHGTDIWWVLPVEELLPPDLVHLAPTLRRGDDTMDVWFDSGSSWAGVLQAGKENGLRYPADLYLEGTDQHRGGHLYFSHRKEVKTAYKGMWGGVDKHMRGSVLL